MIDLTYFGFGVGSVIFFWFMGSIIGAVFNIFQDKLFKPGGNINNV